MLTEGQISFYHSHGYISVENILTHSELTEAKKIVGDFVEKSRSVDQHNEIFDLEPGHAPENPRLRRIKTPVRFHPFFDQLMRSKKILSAVADLIGPNIRYQSSKLNLKSADFGSPVEWHQDFAFYPHTNDDILACGVAFDDCTEENGCLMVVPGSHKGPVYDHHQNGRFAGAVNLDKCDLDFAKAVPINLKSGDISLHHARLLHGSAPNLSNKPRRLLLFEYVSADAWPLRGVADLEEFDSRIVWGEPQTLYRTSPMYLRVPLPPAERSGSIYETQTILEKRYFNRK